VKVKVPVVVGVPPMASPQQPKVAGKKSPGGKLPRTTVKTGSPELVDPPVMAIF
jgi:hypothetical protein